MKIIRGVILVVIGMTLFFWAHIYYKKKHNASSPSAKSSVTNKPINCGSGGVETWVIEGKQWEIERTSLMYKDNRMTYFVTLSKVPTELSKDMDPNSLIKAFTPFLKYVHESKKYDFIYNRKGGVQRNNGGVAVDSFDISFGNVNLKIGIEDIIQLMDD